MFRKVANFGATQRLFCASSYMSGRNSDLIPDPFLCWRILMKRPFMRKFFTMISAAAALCLLAASCSVMGSDYLSDISPIVLQIYLSDEDGANLLDPELKDNPVHVKDISATFRGRTFSVGAADGGDIDTRGVTFYPEQTGLRLVTDFYGNYMLLFGAIDGQENLDNEDLVLNWGDGTSDVITIFNNFRWKSNGSPSITRRFYVNGEKQESDIATFRLVR